MRTREARRKERLDYIARVCASHPLGKYAVGWWSVPRLLELKRRWEAGELAPDIAEDFGYSDPKSISNKAKECGFKRSDGFLVGFAKHHVARRKMMEDRIRRVLHHRQNGVSWDDMAKMMGLTKHQVAHAVRTAFRRGIVKVRLHPWTTEHQHRFIAVCYRYGVTVETIRKSLRLPGKDAVFQIACHKLKIRHRNSNSKLRQLLAPDRLLAYELAAGDPRDLLMKVYRRMTFDRRSEIVDIWRNYNEALAAIPSLQPADERADVGMDVLTQKPRRPAFEWRKRKRKDKRLRDRVLFVIQARPESRAFL